VRLALAEGRHLSRRERALARRMKLEPERLAAERRVVEALRSGGPTLSPQAHARLDALALNGAHPRIGPLAARRWRPRGRLLLGAAGALACALAAVVVLTLPRPHRTLSATTVASLWTLPASSPAPPPLRADPGLLAASVSGVAFPNYHDSEGWRPSGGLTAHIAGRLVRIVFYRTGARRAAYIILAGSRLAVPADARRFTLFGIRLTEFRSGDHWIVTFRRRGATCVLVARAPRERTWLLKLAIWPHQLPSALA